MPRFMSCLGFISIFTYKGLLFYLLCFMIQSAPPTMHQCTDTHLTLDHFYNLSNSEMMMSYSTDTCINLTNTCIPSRRNVTIAFIMRHLNWSRYIISPALIVTSRESNAFRMSAPFLHSLGPMRFVISRGVMFVICKFSDFVIVLNRC